MCARVAIVCKKNVFLDFIFEICKRDCDDWVYILTHLARIFSSEQRFCECLYFFGPSKMGKDALAGAIEKAVGDKAEGGFGGGLPRDFLSSSSKDNQKGKESCTPFLNDLEGCKTVIIPEFPVCKVTKEADMLDMNMLKQMTEQAGAKITSRAAHGNPSRKSPTFEILLFSNAPPRPDLSDTASRRRLGVFELRNRFQDKPTEGETQDKGDLKDKIQAGVMNPSMFIAATHFYKFLSLYTTAIHRPPHVEEACESAFGADLGEREPGEDPMVTFVRKYFAPVESVADAAKETDVIKEFRAKHAEEGLGFLKKLGDAKTKMRDLGFVLGERQASKHYVLYKHFAEGVKKVSIRAPLVG